MGLNEKQTNRGLACLGLSFHEMETARLVVELLRHRLACAWHWCSIPQADALVVDRDHIENNAVLDELGENTVAIALLDHDAVGQTSRAIYRPFSPRALIAVLNAIDQPVDALVQDDHTPGSKVDTGWQNLKLSEAFRAAAVNDSIGLVAEIAGLSDDHLVIDAERDRIYGPVDALSLSVFAGDERFQVRFVNRSMVAHPQEESKSRQLCTFLVQLADKDVDHICVFGDVYRSKVRLNTWPDLSSLQIGRAYIKAVTLVRHSAYTVTAAAAFAGVNAGTLLQLFNALYINGTLDIDTRMADGADAQVPPQDDSSNHVLNRIREQVGMGMH